MPLSCSAAVSRGMGTKQDHIKCWLATWRLIPPRRAADIQDFWPAAWSLVIASEVTRLAFDRSSHELAEASNSLARAIVAQLHVEAVAVGRSGPSRELRQSLVLRLLNDWEQVVYARSGFFVGRIKRAATRMLRSHRNGFSDMAALPVGDVLLYQSRGGEVRDFIRAKIAAATPPITIVAHSLGGIACVDLLAMRGAPAVSQLVTVGSQSPLLYEIGALASLKPPQALPTGFPPWLNIFDRSDFLSYVAKRLFPSAEDLEVDSGQPFPDSHSAYFGNERVWAGSGLPHGTATDDAQDEMVTVAACPDGVAPSFCSPASHPLRTRGREPRMWQQVYDPFGNFVLSTIAAAIPVVTLLVLIATGAVRTHLAALIALLVAIIIAIFLFTMPAGLAIRATILGAVIGFFPIGWIVLNVIFMYRLTVATGAFGTLQQAIGGVTSDRRLQLLLIAFAFGAFFEGASGFGTPVAVTAAVLIGLGFSPLAASGLSLIANTAPVAYGALGTPIAGLASVTGLDPYLLGAMVGRQLPFFSPCRPG